MDESDPRQLSEPVPLAAALVDSVLFSLLQQDPQLDAASETLMP